MTSFTLRNGLSLLYEGPWWPVGLTKLFTVSHQGKVFLQFFLNTKKQEQFTFVIAYVNKSEDLSVWI